MIDLNGVRASCCGLLHLDVKYKAEGVNSLKSEKSSPSRTGETGIFWHNISQLPSEVYILTENPRTSRRVSEDPVDPVRFEKRAKTGVVRDMSHKTPASVTSSAL